MKNLCILKNIWKFKVAGEEGSHVKTAGRGPEVVGWDEIKYEDNEVDLIL